MNSILYSLNINFVSKETFSIDDFHNRNIDNVPQMLLEVESSNERKYDCKEAILNWFHKLIIQTDWLEVEWSKIQSLKSLQKKPDGKDDENFQAFWATRYFPIFYINFHNIKEEISTKKTSWWNLKSFLGKHIQKLVIEDKDMHSLKPVYESMVNSATDFILDWSKLAVFTEKIKKNYNQNLRDNNIEIDFWLPEYEDIFLQMMFKIGLNGSKTNLVPIDHFWDGYISMFVMAVIQAIAEENTGDKCLFLFEEPESFLHENHQEYFYKMVLSTLAEKWHQVIYTTHSDKMVDIFDTRWLIRLELEECANEETGEISLQTVKKYNKIDRFYTELQAVIDDGEIITIEKYNEFIKTIEPNLNRILFSRKVLLVEWPNDILVYKHCIEKIVEERIQHRTDIENKKRWAEAYLNFHNISIIPHHGKSTAIYLIEVCKWFWLDFYVINDWDFETTELELIKLNSFSSLHEMQQDSIYTTSNKKWMITTNFNLIKNATPEKIHFNTPKLEKVIWYNFDDKSSVKIHKHITESSFDYKNEELFPQELIIFLEINKIS